VDRSKGRAMKSGKQYWFPAKKIGWGWGPPATWQGWVATGLYVLLFAAGALFWRPDRQLPAFLLWSILVSALFVAVCWMTGEPPRWRSGR